jgi:hypothetical protein
MGWSVRLINEACGKAVGFTHPLLYGNAGAFRQISKGDSKSGQIGYDAGSGWNACTGLGVPNGDALLKIYKQAFGGSSGTSANLLSDHKKGGSSTVGKAKNRSKK